MTDNNTNKNTAVEIGEYAGLLRRLAANAEYLEGHASVTLRAIGLDCVGAKTAVETLIRKKNEAQKSSMIDTARDDNRIRNLSLAALHQIAAETNSDVPHIIALLTEPRPVVPDQHVGANNAQAGSLPPAQVSPVGNDPAAIPSFLTAKATSDDASVTE